MIIVALLTLSAPERLDLSKFPSPAYLHNVCRQPDGLQKYRAAVSDAKEVFDKFAKLKQDEKIKAITQWSNSVRKDHVTNNTARVSESTDLTYFRHDLGRLDLLLLNLFDKSAFHTKSWLCYLYNVELDANYRVVGIKLNPESRPEVLFGKFGPPSEPPFVSFDADMSGHAGVFWKWLDSGFKGKGPEEVTLEKLMWLGKSHPGE